MNSSGVGRPKRNTNSKRAAVSSFRRAGGRMPPAQQRRLDYLLHKGRTKGLHLSEQRELEAILEEIDRRSFWMLARRMLEPSTTAGAKRAGPAKRAAAGG
jgi:hypothetical protein